MNIYKTLLAVTVVALTIPVAPAFAAVQVVENGILTGATGVDVGGTLYDVSFLDGTCVALFGGCDSASDFAFNDSASASLAAAALLDQVFLDTAAGAFDSNPALTRGCGDSEVCFTIIPYRAVGNGLAGSRSQNGVDSDRIDPEVFSGTTIDLGDASRSTFARFTLSNAVVSAVPEPSTWAMMLIGFGGMGVALRRRRRANLSQFA